MSKPFYESKVFWFNLMTLALMIIDVISQQQLVSVDGLKWLMLISAFGNMMLRFLTIGPLDTPQVLNQESFREASQKDEL